MIKIKDALAEVLRGNEYLDYALHHNLLNNAQVAKYLLPYIEIRTKKSVSMAALQMALVRYNKELNKKRNKTQKKPKGERISTILGLRIETYSNDIKTHAKIQKFYECISEKSGYLSITEGLDEITIVYEEKFVNLAISEKPKFTLLNVAAVNLHFSAEYLKYSGMLHSVMHTMLVQGINILEVASTSTSIILYVHSKDVKLAFNTLYDRLL
ncbi:MAG TPA: hypothetical protein VEA59_01395 [Patescibacteria group bacterium]|nr:hypothetical protein [Patescibacteria group bacterium]